MRLGTTKSRAAFGRTLQQDRGLDFKEGPVAEKAANEANDLMAQAQVTGQFWAAQVEIPIFQADGLVDIVSLVAADNEWRRARFVQNREAVGDDFDFAGFQFRVFESLRPLLDCTAHLHDEFTSHLGGGLERLRPVLSVTGRGCPVRRVERRVIGNCHLRDAETVAQVEKDQAAVIAAAVDPTGKGDRFAGVGGA